MKKLIISLVVSVPLLLASASSFAIPGSVAYERLDSTSYVHKVAGANAAGGTQYAWYRGHRGYGWHRGWHRGYGWNRGYRWHRWHRRYW